MKILIIGGISRSLINFRGALITAMLTKGHEVIASAGEPLSEVTGIFDSWGVPFIPVRLARTGVNPANDIHSCLQLRRIMCDHRPGIVLSYTIKPVIWGGLAVRFFRPDIKFYALITGLGMVFQPGGVRKRLLMKLVTSLYRVALAGVEKTIFQNEGNRDVFVRLKIVEREKTLVVNGSGVNLDHFTTLPLPKGDLTFLTIARLLGDKGLRELYSASRKLIDNCELLMVAEDQNCFMKKGVKFQKQSRRNFNIQLLGPIDPSPDGIPLTEVQSWHDTGALTYLGATNDVRPFIADCHVYVLPSYHEGMPRTVLEAMAAGRPIITTDIAGCRETVPLTDKGKAQKERGEQVMEGENGFLVRVKDTDALAQAMQRFINQPELISVMGKRSREIAEEKYDVHEINTVMLKAMGL